MSVIRRLWALDGGRLSEDRNKLVLRQSGPVTVPCPSFLMEHDRGLVLLDTGLAPNAAEDASATYGSLADRLNILLSREQCIDRQIERLGFKTSDVDYVIMSHLHWDHTGGMYLFPQAKFFVMQGELQYAYWPLPGSPPYRREDIDPTRGFDWHEIDAPDFDFFGDGTLRLLHMPGHTPGNASLIVRLGSGNVILACDTAHLQSGLRDDLPMPSDWNTMESVRSMRKLKQIAHVLDASIWIPHDVEDWDRFRNLMAPDICF
ncbi:N-acyl homoserine lactonase family protein [Acidisoma silvae]|uniref:N-acyl homoserine lactonase family protein n=1 Tax=Acidisoma silvae TaxID=2802396 RepID=A0A963YXB3_9PROT|nr:N-acyl homoserine lactonase family protein [Acidisoma silvae]MCB8878030.1 N-acyl homoserine lactonase family protein [Acidisoma silvae]